MKKVEKKEKRAKGNPARWPKNIFHTKDFFKKSWGNRGHKNFDFEHRRKEKRRGEKNEKYKLKKGKKTKKNET